MTGWVKHFTGTLLTGGALSVMSASALAQAESPKPTGAQIAANATAPERVVVTARLRHENPQDVPISLSVITLETLQKTSTYNVSQLSQLIPSLNYASPNPRNAAYTIRGLGSSVVAISQANDGLEPGVGFYVDGIYQARPAAASFDFVDIDRIEILRGPQGTLFGKNTTAGAINIAIAAPSFAPEVRTEISGGNFGFFQGKATLSGPLVDNLLAARVSANITRRDGVIENVKTGGSQNDIDSQGFRGQLLYRPDENFRLRLTGDYSAIDNTCCTQVFVRVGNSLKPAARQYPALASGIAYAPPSVDPFARKTDIDSALAVTTSQGGVAAIADWTLGAATLSSLSAWRWWDWDAANDRDYTGLSIQTVQHIPSRQIQYSQELRIASNQPQSVDYVAGLYWFEQSVRSHPITQYGRDGAYWLLGSPPAIPSNLLDGYVTEGRSDFTSRSYAAFGEFSWHITDSLSLNPGLRYTAEDKDGSFASAVSGGLSTGNAALIAQKLSILRPQAYSANVADGSLSGRISADYHATGNFMAYGIYAYGYKSGGINMSGLPLNPANLPALATAVVKPEKNSTAEFGVKTDLFDGLLTLNLNAFHTIVRDFQTNVVDTGPGALRGYLANIGKVRVQGVELDSAFTLDENFSGHVSSTWSDGKYVSYANGPCPLELIATATTVCDLSGRPLPNLPRWALSLGGEYSHPASLGALSGNAYLHVEASTRSGVYGEPADSRFAIIAGFTTVNASLGFRAGAFDVFFWVRNLFDQNALQNLTVQAGNSGLIVGTPNDPRMFGLTLAAHY